MSQDLPAPGRPSPRPNTGPGGEPHHPSEPPASPFRAWLRREWLAGKISRLRIFSDAAGNMNAGIPETGGEVLVVSQFTLHASTKKGNRPSFIRAARPEVAIPLYEGFLECLETALGKPVARGVFGADMKVGLVNDGPVTIWMDSKARE